MKIKNRVLLSVVFALIFTFALSCGICYAVTRTEQSYESESYSNATIDQNFDDSSVLVTLDKSVGGINKIHSIDFFGDIGIIEIKDLTRIDKDPEDCKYLDIENFHQILKLKLNKNSKQNVLDVLSRLEQIDGIKSACPNYYDTPAEVQDFSLGSRYQDQWNLHGENGIDADLAWQITTGSSSVRVGVIDTGIANHPDLVGNIGFGYDFVNENYVTDDDISGHGTKVASIIGANGENINGILGVCPNVQLIPLQVVTYGANNAVIFDTSAIAAAVNWAINNDIPILNYSGASINNDMEIESEFFWEETVGIHNYLGLFVTAVSNEKIDIDELGTQNYPAEFAQDSLNIMSVGALNQDNECASNFGRSISIYAPGGGIYTVDNDESYLTTGGSSMAVPHVTGVAALMLSIAPQLTGAELKEIILNTTDDFSLIVPDGNWGYTELPAKKLNAYKAVLAAQYLLKMDNDGVINGFYNGYDYTREYLIIPEDLYGENDKGVAANLFANNTNLKVVSFPNTFETIGDNAFKNCVNLESVSFGNNISSIGQNAFMNCGKLGTILINTSKSLVVGTSAFENCENIGFISITAQTLEIQDKAFKNVNKLTQIMIDSTTTSFGTQAFYGCNDLIVLVVNGDVSQVGIAAFYNSLIELAQIPTTLVGHIPTQELVDLIIIGGETIQSQAFANCPNLLNVTLMNIVNIGDEAFANCQRLENVYLKDLISTGVASFANCQSLTNVIFENVTNIGDEAFYDCINLEEVSLGDGLTNIGEAAFCYCEKLEEVIFPNTVTTIDDAAFGGCVSLESITLPVNLEYIGDFAFALCCSQQKHLTFPNDVTHIGLGAFLGWASLEYIKVPFVGEFVDDYDLTATNSHFGYIFGAETYADNNSFVPASLKRVDVDGGVYIGSYAFYDCENITSILIKDEIYSIGVYAFTGCDSLVSITLENPFDWYASIYNEWDPIQVDLCDIFTAVQKFLEYEGFYWRQSWNLYE